MPILIDGHNLIPKIPGLHLKDLNDEMRLVEMLQEYTRRKRKGMIECYFDRAAEGNFPRVQRFGLVQTRFARRNSTADAEIVARLESLSAQARNYRVVSSDWRIRNAARAAGAKDQSAEDFARELLETLASPENPKTPNQKQESPSEQEVVYWLSQFRKPRRGDKDRLP